MNKSFETIESISIREHESGVHLAQSLLDALSKGEIGKDLAFNLLDEVRNVIKYSYDLRMEACMGMGQDIEGLDANKRDDLKHLDAAVYQASENISRTNVTPEAQEQIDSLLR